MVGRDGDAYIVVYPGRPADGGGPDFRDAVLRGPDGTLLRGDVEIHVRDSGWRAHRHHLDPRYNGVAFHVTAESETDPDTAPDRVGTLSRRRINFLVLGTTDHADTPRDYVSNPPESVQTGSVSQEMLTRFGDQRFLGRSSGLALALRSGGGDQAVWAALLDCLGYSRNRRGFRQVARRLPWSLVLEALDSGADASALLMWGGGFGPRPAELRRPATGEPPEVPAPEWVHGGRPDNRPERRIAAAAAFAERWHRTGPLRSAVRAVDEASKPGDLIREFQVDGSTAEAGPRALVGEGRAREITVNAILPLVHGWVLLADRWDVAEKALRLFRDHPKLPANAVTREMASLLAECNPALKIDGARVQQGLILMYRAMTAGPLYVMPPAPED